jgi:hypothetical protein
MSTSLGHVVNKEAATILDISNIEMCEHRDGFFSASPQVVYRISCARLLAKGFGKQGRLKVKEVSTPAIAATFK